MKPESIINKLKNIDPLKFENLVADLWEYLGYETEVTKASSDRGIDVVATREFPYKEKVLIQAKRYSSSISGPELREYVALGKQDDVDTVIVVSTSGFTRQAKQEAEEYNLKLIDGKTLSELLIQENVTDIVKEHIGEIGSADVEQKRSPDRQSDSTQELLTTTGEGEYIQIEIVGYSYEKMRVLGTETDEEFTVVFIEVMNKSKAEWKLRAEKNLSITSAEGYSFNDPLYTMNDVGPWTVGSPKIKRDSKSRIALIYNTTTPIVLEKIEYSGSLSHCRNDVGRGHDLSDEVEEITIPLDKSVQEELNSVPQSFRPELAEVILTSHPDFDG